MGASIEAMTEASRTVTKCRGVRADGEDCGSVIIGESGFCFAHDPDKAEERRSARVRGGVASSNVRRLRRHLDGSSALGLVLDHLESALVQVHEGDLSPARGSAMASIGRALVAVHEVGELDQRIQELEAKLA